MIYTLTFVIAALIFIVLLFASIEFIKEKEQKAFYKSLFLTLSIPLSFLFAWYFDYQLAATILISFFGFSMLILFFPIRKIKFVTDKKPKRKYDERDTIFSINELIPSTERFEDYYRNAPDKKALDNKFRNEPGLLSPKSQFYNPLAFNAADLTSTLAPSNSMMCS